MQPTADALFEGFEFVQDEWAGYFSFRFGDGFELCFEPLLTPGQMYVALYDKNRELLTNKVAVRVGYVKHDS